MGFLHPSGGHPRRRHPWLYTLITVETLVRGLLSCDDRRMTAESARDRGVPPSGSGGSRRHDGTAVDKGLKTGAVGLVSSVVIGMASTAPAYSLAATLGFVVIAVGVKAPTIMLLAFVPMLFIAIAFSELNKREPDCGTTFTWAARAFGPRTGWIGGWGIIAADVIVMANLAQIDPDFEDPHAVSPLNKRAREAKIGRAHV